MSLTRWKNPFEGAWVEPNRPIAEPLSPKRPSMSPLTPPRPSNERPRADFLGPVGRNRTFEAGVRSRQNAKNKNNRAPRPQTIAGQAHEPYADVFAAATLHYAEKQPALDRPQSAVVEFDNLDGLKGQVICCCEFLEAPQRIKLHLTNGTRLVISAKSKREDSGVPWPMIYDTEPELKMFPSLAEALSEIGCHSSEHHDASFNGGKRIRRFQRSTQVSGRIEVNTLGMRLEGMFRLMTIRCEADDEELYDVVLSEDVDNGDVW
ncbi:hypothetical protein BU16DRAFT_556023 [Lophium mytilinum]|uniref:Uncharacterized protein n=1 Tax=Lophium mytilinum TaxID=390894 RepID=A0A6A6RCT0_9PEZI|nr:hypothetical protein BU16DRAFT_556023 [Lophium mytilinum]